MKKESQMDKSTLFESVMGIATAVGAHKILSAAELLLFPTGLGFVGRIGVSAFHAVTVLCGFGRGVKIADAVVDAVDAVKEVYSRHAKGSSEGGDKVIFTDGEEG